MKKEEIFFGDWKRLLLGNAPPEFLLEVLIRTVIILIAFMIIARYLGKRMSGQLTLTEMAVMLTLGAIISPVMQLPDRGLFMGVLALLCILAFQRGLNLLAFKNKKVEEITQGVESVLIKDGILMLEHMRMSRISKQQVFAQLRSKNIYNIKQVKRMYIEACGLFSIYTNEEVKPGLSVLPEFDPEVHVIQQSAGDNVLVCKNCGTTIPAQETQKTCEFCEEKQWIDAVC